MILVILTFFFTCSLQKYFPFPFQSTPTRPAASDLIMLKLSPIAPVMQADRSSDITIVEVSCGASLSLNHPKGAVPGIIYILLYIFIYIYIFVPYIVLSCISFIQRALCHVS